VVAGLKNNIYGVVGVMAVQSSVLLKYCAAACNPTAIRNAAAACGAARTRRGAVFCGRFHLGGVSS